MKPTGTFSNLSGEARQLTAVVVVAAVVVVTGSGVVIES